MRGRGESSCDAVIVSIYGKGSILKCGRNDRASHNTKGMPDRWYLCGPYLLAWESKEGDDQLSVEQRTILDKLMGCEGVRVGCGNRDDLWMMLQLVSKPEKAAKLATALIQKWSTRKGATTKAKAATA